MRPDSGDMPRSRPAYAFGQPVAGIAPAPRERSRRPRGRARLAIQSAGWGMKRRAASRWCSGPRRPRCCAPRRAPETVRSTWPNPAGRQRATAGRGAPRWRSVRGRRRRSGRAHTSSTSAPRTADAAEAHATTPHRRCLWPTSPPAIWSAWKATRSDCRAGASCWCRTSPARAWPAAVRCRSSPRHDRALTAAALARTLTHDRTEDVPSDADRLLSAGRGGPAGVFAG